MSRYSRFKILAPREEFSCSAANCSGCSRVEMHSLFSRRCRPECRRRYLLQMMTIGGANEGER